MNTELLRKVNAQFDETKQRGLKYLVVVIGDGICQILQAAICCFNFIPEQLISQHF
jgi:hypothetical protein